MVERRLLTKEFVDAVSLPSSGERWIADTKLRGFGLRLWRTKRGEGKAFAIRAIDLRGRSIRRTYDGEARNEYWPPLYQVRSLGDVLEAARNWAAAELNRAKGKPTLRDEERENRERFTKHISRLTLDALAQARFRGMRTRGLTERYIDTLTKLYLQNIPPKLRSKKLTEIKPQRLAKIFDSLNSKPGSASTLRAFIIQIVKDSGLYTSPLYHAFCYAREFPAPTRYKYLREDIREFPGDTFKEIFSCLERKRKDWIQATFIRLLFEFHVPADRLMKAKWAHISDNRWYPWPRNERKYWWVHTRIIDDTVTAVLERHRMRVQEQFGDSPFIFPSTLSATGHIRSYLATWKQIALLCSVRHEDLPHLIRSYQWSIVMMRRLAYRQKHYGNIVQSQSHRLE